MLAARYSVRESTIRTWGVRLALNKNIGLSRQQIIKIENAKGDYTLNTLEKYLSGIRGKIKIEFSESLKKMK